MRHVSDADIQAIERKMTQTMDIIVSKKKRIALAKRQSQRFAAKDSKMSGKHRITAVSTMSKSEAFNECFVFAFPGRLC
jgi:hypothetical protein